MPALLQNVLPWVYSQGNRAQRALSGLLSDPLGTAQQAMGQMNDNAQAQDDLMSKAFANPSQPFQVTDQGAMAQAGSNMLSGLLGVAPAGITAWHGSPHAFDAFDSSKIGTGEGAQAYGHGLYLAEAPQVASKYAQDLAASRQSLANRSLQSAGSDVDQAIANAASEIERLRGLPNGGGDPVRLSRMVALQQEKLTELGKLKAGQQMSQPNLYKVDLPDSTVGQMLDWDKPLSQQPPEVRKSLSGFYGDNMTGQQIYQDWARESLQTQGAGADHNAYAADLAKKFGLRGISYLDGASRGAGQGSRNFVVFPGEEGRLKILERNGKPVR